LPSILLSRQLASSRGLVAGDVVRISASRDGSAARAFRLAGTYEPVPDPMKLTAERYEARLHLPHLLELTTNERAAVPAEAIQAINLALREGADAASVRRELGRRLPGLVVAPTRGGDAMTELFVVLERFHQAIAAVTVLGATAFLLALMIMRADERREVVGILRLIGMSRRRVLAGVLAEGLIIALAGALFGIAWAMLNEGLYNRFFQWRYDTTLVFVRVTPSIALRSVAIAVPLGLAAGLAASWTLLRRETVELLRR
jgi:putative ABC transport system permease protein